MFGFSTLFNFLAPHDCLLCGLEGSLLCQACRRLAYKPAQPVSLSGLKDLWIGAAYKDVLRQLVRIYKFERAQAVADVLAELLDQAAPHFPARTLVTFVPTASSRVRKRGYDHARVLAQAFARKRGTHVTPLLFRVGQTRQVGAKRSVRLNQLANAYVVKDPEQVRGMDIVVVDDIVTTGGTLMASAGVLLEAGAGSVTGLVVGRRE